MAPCQANRNIQKVGRQRSVPKDEKARPQGIKKALPQLSSRRSARLQHSKDTSTEPKHPLPSPSSITPGKEFLQSEDRKRKRKRKQSQEDEAPLSTATPPQKRPRSSPQGPHIENTIGANTVSGKDINPPEYRRKEGRRSKKYFEAAPTAALNAAGSHRNASLSPPPEEVEHTLSEDELSPIRQRGSPEGRGIGDASPEDTSNIKDSNAVTRWIEGKPWPKEYFEQESTMNPLLKRKTSSSLSKKSETSDGSAVREGKNPAAKSRLYEMTLEAANIYMGGGPGITDTCQTLCKSLLKAKQPLPPDSLFRDDRFEKTCERLRNENEAKVIRDITPLLVPSVEVLCAYGEEHLESMVDHVNQKWHGCVPIAAGPVPQPDYSAGCKATIFTKGQLRKLEPFIRGWKSTPFLATAWMYFPYLTMEVKCGNEGLNIADRQNAHSSSVAVKQVVDLYRKVSRQHELDRKILSFSISHDQEAVRIYGHYPVIDGDQTSIYRHTIKKFDITSDLGIQKWTTYTFTRNVYDIYGPLHIERLRSAVDQLPDPLSDQHQSQQSDLEVLSQPDEEESQSDIVESQDLLQSAPSSQTSQPSFKKPRSKRS